MKEIRSVLCALTQRSAGYIVLLVLSILVQAGSRPIVARRHQNNNMKAVIFVTIGITAVVFLIVISYIAKRLCPRGLTFRALLELDDIHIGNINTDDDLETGIKANIKRLTDKLTTNRKKSKKYEVQADRDMKRRLERGERPSDKSREVGFAEAWQDSPVKSTGPTPVKNPLTTPSKGVEPSTYREATTTASKTKHSTIKETGDDADEQSEEEKEDMWRLWNTMRQDKDQQVPLLGSPPASETGRGAKKASTGDRHELPRGPPGQSATPGNIATNPRPLPYDSVQRPVLQGTFELSSSGKFDPPSEAVAGGRSPPPAHHHAAPTAQSATPSTYTYNNNTYNVVHSSSPSGLKATSTSGAVENGSHGKGSTHRSQVQGSTAASPTRKQPPVLDLSKITSPPAHIRPPPTKPPPSVAMVRLPSSSSTAEIDRTSIKPTMRSFSPSKRPPPPAGPKPPSRPNPDALVTSNNNTPALTRAAAAVDSGAAGGSGARPGPALGPPGGTAVKTMKRPPPPLLAPPPGYIPGNSARHGSQRNSARGSARTDSARDTKEA